MHGLLALFFLVVLPSLAAPLAAGPVEIVAVDATLAPGANGTVGVSLQIQSGYHVYTDMLEVKLVGGAGLIVLAAQYPEGETAPDPASPGQLREQYEGVATVRLPVTVPKSVRAGTSHAVQMHVRYQACTVNLCAMPVEEDVTAMVTVPKPAGALTPALFLGLLASPAWAGDPAAEEKAVVFTAGAPRDDHIVIHADLQGDWHLNKMFVGVTLPAGSVASGLTLGAAILPPAVASGKVEDGSFREDFQSDFQMLVPVSGPEGNRTVEVEVAFQACKGAEFCRMPTSERMTLPVHLTGVPLAPAGGAAPPGLAPVVELGSGPAVPVAEVAPVAAVSPNAVALAAPVAPGAAAPASALGGSPSAFAVARDQGFLALVVLCFLAGIGVSFTPCVLPMVPITMGMIGARGASSRVESALFTSAYVLGLASVYTLLGVFAGVTGQLFGSWLQSPWVVGGIAVFFIAMGASMFGFFDVQLPAALAGRIQSGERKGGYAGAFVVGMIGAVVAGPCSGPVVVSILALIGDGGVQVGAALMFSFSFGIGMIFFVTGMASGWLPSRGPWMVVVKKSFGIVMWLGAIYYAAPQLPVSVTALATSAVCIVTGVFSWPSEEDGEGWLIQRLRQSWTVIGVTTGVWLLVATMMTQGFILPPVQLGGAAAASRPRIVWMDNEEKALAAALASGKPVIIDFTAEWCAACHEMERLTYTDGAVIAESLGFVTVMIDCTLTSDPAIVALQKKYGVLGLPAVRFVTAAGQPLQETQGFVAAPEFLLVMQAAKAAAGV